MRTNRLKLIPINHHDFEVFKEINTNALVRKHLWDDQIMPDNVFRQMLNDVEFHFKKHHWGLWKILLPDSQVIIGYAGLWLFFDEHQPQLVYALRPEYAGKGYATESAKLIVDYAFKELRFESLVATMDKGNIKSQRVCERLAFQLAEERVIEGKPILFYRLNNSKPSKTNQ
jgi:ribosomal-protein-alanine N-acetyltransferase